MSASSSASVPGSFEEYLLSLIARNPGLISESHFSLQRSGTPKSASTLDATHKALLAPYLTSPSRSAAIASENSTSTADAKEGAPAVEAATAALLQRAVVDSPLLPSAGSHLLYETVLSAFAKAAAAAKRVKQWKDKKASSLSAVPSVTAVGATTIVNGGHGDEEEQEKDKLVASPTETETAARVAAEWQEEGIAAEKALTAAKEELAAAFQKTRWVVSALATYVAKQPEELKQSNAAGIRAALQCSACAPTVKEGEDTTTARAGGAAGLKRARE